MEDLEFEVFGTKRGFKLGTYTFKLINKLAGTKTIDDVFLKLKEDNEDFTSVFYFCCAKHWHLSNKLPIDFEEVHVADWMDEIGQERMKHITGELFKIFLEKNLKAPVTGLEGLQSSNGKH